jgi:hypothetical protein
MNHNTLLAQSGSGPNLHGFAAQFAQNTMRELLAFSPIRHKFLFESAEVKHE